MIGYLSENVVDRVELVEKSVEQPRRISTRIRRPIDRYEAKPASGLRNRK